MIGQWDRDQRCPECKRKLVFKVVGEPPESDRVHFRHCECGNLRPSISVYELEGQYALENEHAMVIGNVPDLSDLKKIPLEHREAAEEDERERRKRLRGQ